MANNLKSQTWYVDTTGTLIATGRRFRLTGVQWISASASAGDTVIITDGPGNRIWGAVAAGSNQDTKDGPNRFYNGLIVTTLASGYLLLDID